MKITRGATLVFLLLIAGTVFVPRDYAREPNAVAERLRPSGIDGAVMLCGGGEFPESARERFVKLAGGEKAEIVIFPDYRDAAGKADAEKQLEPWKSCKPASVTLAPLPLAKEADVAGTLAKLRTATGVWLGDVHPSFHQVAFGPLSDELRGVLKRGGAVGGTGGGAAALARHIMFENKDKDDSVSGLGLLPGALWQLNFPGKYHSGDFASSAAKKPGVVGLGVPAGTALLVRGREMRVFGDGAVSVFLPKSPARAARTIEIKSGGVSDWTMLRRAAMARADASSSSKEAAPPEVASGSLVIVGGGGMPADIVKRFIDLAGGPDALIVVLPTALEPGFADRGGDEAMFRRAGAKNIEILRAKELAEVEDPKTLEILKKAKGVWFGGGRQWRFVDTYAGTKAEALFRDVLRRGGVIGGSSAGATIQGDYLCRGSPLGNLEMMCEGYERGLAFLPGVAIDQHFSQRNRFNDMTAMMSAFPQYLGIGIDEATALVVHGHVAEIMGKNKVQFYDRKKPVQDGKPDYEVVQPGGMYDLKNRKILSRGDEKSAGQQKHDGN
jgi:cyanophycinase